MGSPDPRAGPPPWRTNFYQGKTRRTGPGRETGPAHNPPGENLSDSFLPGDPQGARRSERALSQGKKLGFYQGKTSCTRFSPGENRIVGPCTRFSPGEILVWARAARHPGVCQGKTWYTSFSPGAATSPPGKYQGKTWWTDLAGHPRFPPGVCRGFTRHLPWKKLW